MNRISYIGGYAFFVLSAASLGAQRSGSTATARAPLAARIVLTVRDSAAHVYREESGAGITDSLRLVIKDSASFAAFWNRLVRPDDRSYYAYPVIDFENQDVIVVALGAYGAWGPQISIDTVKVQSDVRVVVVRRILPPDYCLGMSEGWMLGRPVDVIASPRDSVRTTRFIERVVHLKRCR